MNEKDRRVFRTITKSLVNTMNTEKDYEQIIQKSAYDLQIKPSQLKGYLILTTLRAFQEISQEKN